MQRLQSDRLELRANVLRCDLESAHPGLAPFERIAGEEVNVRCDRGGTDDMWHRHSCLRFGNYAADDEKGHQSSKHDREY
jgi:hypothetical protein